jgi:hypothetical protein
VSERPTVGVLDLGGASFQIAVQHDRMNKAPYTITFGSQRIGLYASSYLGYGMFKALAQVSRAIFADQTAQGLPLEHPCYSRNFEGKDEGKPFIGTGDFDRCAKAASTFLTKAIDFKSVIIHDLSSTKEFIGLFEFYYANKILKLPPNSTLAQLRDAGAELCRTNWSDIDLGQEQPFVNTSCWTSAYQWVLLTHGYHFADGRIIIRKLHKIHGLRLSWPLGAMLSHAGDIEICKSSGVPITVYLLLLVPVFLWGTRRLTWGSS